MPLVETRGDITSTVIPATYRRRTTGAPPDRV